MLYANTNPGSIYPILFIHCMIHQNFDHFLSLIRVLMTQYKRTLGVYVCAEGMRAFSSNTMQPKCVRYKTNKYNTIGKHELNSVEKKEKCLSVLIN